MRLYGQRVFVDDLAEARRFYTGILGLPVAWEFAGVAFGLDVGCTLIIEAVAANGDAEDRALVGRFVGCSLAVDDIDQAYADLTERGVSFSEPPERQPWGGTLAHFRDPSGNVLTLLGGAQS
jgi:catechol 2,3-dioxygenase-like lactoylglutathione lyase family enzyme